MTRRLTIWLLILLPYNSFGQHWQLVKQVEFGEVDKFTLDQVGNIYVANLQGEVAKYSPVGELMVEYAPTQVAGIHEITASTQFKVSLFYKDLQEFVVLNRYLSSPIRYRLPDFRLGYVEEVAPNFQQALWALDISDFALKLVDFRENRLLEQKSLAQVLDRNLADIVSFHSHQNRMYVIDKSSGIHVFDNIGNYMFKLMEKTPSSTRFNKDYLYYRKDGYLNLIHLYEGEDLKLSVQELDFTRLAYGNDRLVAITPKGFNIYKYLSGQ
ncbi:MAG: hypothetical protein ABJO02_00400 [Reichenbachiella sp.]|uniref:hypothetical protein n=1 Tax=Reichenbachiella sp. TaxID=2184521 RepID=UPI003297589C